MEASSIWVPENRDCLQARRNNPRQNRMCKFPNYLVVYKIRVLVWNPLKDIALWHGILK